MATDLRQAPGRAGAGEFHPNYELVDTGDWETERDFHAPPSRNGWGRMAGRPLFCQVCKQACRDDAALREHYHEFHPEVAARLRAWKQQGLDLYVYSSGSVAAQQLFFGYSEAGDLRPLFSGYFDTEIGGKREQAAYERIAAAIGVPAGEILFLSDIVEELDAARAAGLATTWLCRPPLHCPADAAHRCVADFDAVTRDPRAPERLRPEFDSGDHIHPNDAGNAAMAEAIDTAWFVRRDP